MQKLHLVGFTTDHRSLILSVRRGARSGRYVLELDDKITASVTEAIARRAAAFEDESSDAAPEPAALRPQSALTVRELQTRLRAGRSVEEVATEAGVEPEWVERFAPPVLAEQARVIAAARAAHFERSRLGSSGLPLGTAVYRNLVARGVRMTADELDNGWTARQGADGCWLVTLTYSSRGRRHQPTWELEGPRGPVRADDRLAAELAYVAGDPPAGSPAHGRHAKVQPATPTDADRQAALRVALARRAAEAQLDEAARAASKRNAERARRGPDPVATEVPSPAAPPSSPVPAAPGPTARKAAKHAAKPAEPAAEPVVAATVAAARPRTVVVAKGADVNGAARASAPKPASAAKPKAATTTTKRKAAPAKAKATPARRQAVKGRAATSAAVTAGASTRVTARPKAKRTAAKTRTGKVPTAKTAAPKTTAAKRTPVKPATKPARGPAAKAKPAKAKATRAKATKAKATKPAAAKKTETATKTATKSAAKARPGGTDGSRGAPVLRSDLADRGGPNGAEGTRAPQHRRREPLRAR